MLSDKSVRLHCTICVHLGHVHIVNEVNELLGPRRSIIPTCLLLQGFLHDLLEHEGVGVIVQRNGSHQSLIFVQAVQFVVDEDSFATASITH